MNVRSITALLALAAGFSLQAAAQGIPDACKADHRKVCPDAKGDKAQSCLRTNVDKLSLACKAALKEAQKK
jgi:hypothetical protein